MADSGLVGAEAHAAFEKAVKLDPNQAKARFYLGIAKYQDGDHDGAVERWKQLLADAPANAPWRPTVMAYIAQVEGKEVRPPALDKETMESAQSMTEAEREKMIRGMVDRLAARLTEDGKDLNGWLRLIRARTVLGERDQAREELAMARSKFADDSNSLTMLNEFAAQLGLETN